VRVVREEARLSERRACGLIGMHRGSWRYQRRERNEVALRARCASWQPIVHDSAIGGCTFSCDGRRTEGGTLRWRVNHKRVYRL